MVNRINVLFKIDHVFKIKMKKITAFKKAKSLFFFKYKQRHIKNIYMVLDKVYFLLRTIFLTILMQKRSEIFYLGL